MPRHVFSKAECQRGGKTRASQPDFVEACQKGFQATKEAHPYFIRREVSRKIQPNPQMRKQERLRAREKH